jgi:hypothetical protein
MSKTNEIENSRRKYLSKAGTLGAVLAWSTPGAVATDGKTLEQSELLGQTPENITLQSSRVYDSVAYFRNYENTGLLNKSGKKYVFVDVEFKSRIDTPRPELSSFGLEVDNGLYEPVIEIHNVPLCRITDRSSIHDGRAYRSEPMDLPEGLVEVPPWMETPTFSFGFVVPQQTTEQASIVFRSNDGKNARWELSNDQIRQIGAKGETTMLQANGRMTADRSLKVELDVENRAKVSKDFKAVINPETTVGNHYVEVSAPPESTISHVEKVPLRRSYESTESRVIEVAVSSDTGNEKVLEVSHDGN